jgi:hypothetical protein
MLICERVLILDALWRYSTQEEGCTDHSFIHTGWRNDWRSGQVQPLQPLSGGTRVLRWRLRQTLYSYPILIHVTHHLQEHALHQHGQGIALQSRPTLLRHPKVGL